MKKLLVMCAAALAACRAAPPGAPALEEIRNASCAGILDSPVQLTGGRWEGEPRMAINLVDGVYLTGDLRGDGGHEAVVLLFETAGGSGGFVHLAVMERVGGRAACSGVARIGDRVQIRTARIDGRRILLDVIQQGPDDAMCCPAQKAARAWRLDQGKLVEDPATVQGTFTLDDLVGSSWVLRRWAWNEEAPPQPEITLTFRQGSISGSSGCNRYNAPIQPGPSAGEVVIGAAAVTRMACPEASMAAEARYLQSLDRVINVSFLATRLALTWRDNNTIDAMILERRPAGAP